MSGLVAFENMHKDLKNLCEFAKCDDTWIFMRIESVLMNASAKILALHYNQHTLP